MTISSMVITDENGDGITLANCSGISICFNVIKNSKGVAISLNQCSNITIHSNYFEGGSGGIYAVNCTNINVVYNQCLNIQKITPRGQFVQFNNSTGSINYNKVENISGASSTEDIINIYKSNGTSTSPIQVIGNWIRGGGPSVSGGGIMLGDSGGSWQIAKNNILVNPGQYGIAIAGGDNQSIVNNSIYASNLPFNNIGIYVWGQAGTIITNANVSDNLINYTNSKGALNGGWNGETTVPIGWSTNNFSSNINLDILPSQIIWH